MKVLITGAHYTPAVAVIEELQGYPEIDIIYVGRKSTREGDPTPSLESQVIPKLGVKFISIITGRLQRSFTVYTIPSLLKIPIGILQSFITVMTQKPDVILSFGGYVAVPVVFIGWLFSIPIIIHEQTLVSGLANKISGLFADKVTLSFPKNGSNKKTIFTGLPIRKDILSPFKKSLNYEDEEFIKDAKKKNFPIILITGGNQGSHALNLAVERCLNKLTSFASVIHQTGESSYNDFESLAMHKNESYLPKRVILSEMGLILSSSDLVVSRAGVNTLIELAYFGIPALVVPIPYLYQDEQNKNARYFNNLGLVTILSQKELNDKTLFKKLKEMVNNLDSLKQQAEKAKQVVIPDAAARLALETILLAKNR